MGIIFPKLVKSSHWGILGPRMLDSMSTPASSAYSFRKLRQAYDGPAVRIRRSSDNTERDIGFTDTGTLNTSAVTSFASGGSAFVVTYYDQSGNDFHATCTTLNAQTRLVNAGVIQTLNTKPAGLSGVGGAIAGYPTAQSASILSREWSFVGSHDTAAADWEILTGGDQAQIFKIMNTHQIRLVKNGSANVFTSTGTGTIGVGGVFGLSLQPGPSTTASFINNVSAGTSAAVGSSWLASTFTLLVGTAATAGKFGEIIVFDVALSSPDRTAMYADQKAFWGTP